MALAVALTGGDAGGQIVARVADAFVEGAARIAVALDANVRIVSFFGGILPQGLNGTAMSWVTDTNGE